MLTHLSIRNIVLIDTLDIDLQAGMTVLSGETGAGKSILLDSLGLILGARAETRLIRKDCEEAHVSARFSFDKNHPIHTILNGLDLPTNNDQSILLRRIISASGGNKIFINDQSVTLNSLKKISAFLVDIHGQFDTHALMKENEHRDLVDFFGGHDAMRQKTRNAWKKRQSLLNDLNALKERLDKDARDEDYLRYVLNELESFSPQQGEHDELEEKRKTLKNKVAMQDSLSAANTSLNGRAGADEKINDAVLALSRIEQFDTENLSPLLDQISNIQTLLSDSLFSFQAILNKEMEEDDSLTDVEERLFTLKDLARKHQCQPDDLINVVQTYRTRLNHIENQEETLRALENALKEATIIFEKTARTLHEARIKTAKIIDKQVMVELPSLKMEKAIFETDIQELEEDKWSAKGISNVSFNIATNPGSSMDKLSKVASGGELSRLMLALKTVLSKDAHGAQTLVFDEVDSGIGGATADAVGEKLLRLSQARQVLVVTHSAQVAAKGHQHFYIEKNVVNQKTVTSIKAIEDETRLEEIARMIAGAEITSEARAHASTLLKAA